MPEVEKTRLVHAAFVGIALGVALALIAALWFVDTQEACSDAATLSPVNKYIVVSLYDSQGRLHILTFDREILAPVSRGVDVDKDGKDDMFLIAEPFDGISQQRDGGRYED